jgi:hypothetical protein
MKCIERDVKNFCLPIQIISSILLKQGLSAGRRFILGGKEQLRS